MQKRDYYLDGKKSGLRWNVTWNYLPGGPYFCDKIGSENNKLWKRGFKDGIKRNKERDHSVIKNVIEMADGLF